MPDPTSFISKKTLTLEQKIGQIMLIGFDGVAVDTELRRMISECHVGGGVSGVEHGGDEKNISAVG